MMNIFIHPPRPLAYDNELKMKNGKENSRPGECDEEIAFPETSSLHVSGKSSILLAFGPECLSWLRSLFATHLASPEAVRKF